MIPPSRTSPTSPFTAKLGTKSQNKYLAVLTQHKMGNFHSTPNTTAPGSADENIPSLLSASIIARLQQALQEKRHLWTCPSPPRSHRQESKGLLHPSPGLAHLEKSECPETFPSKQAHSSVTDSLNTQCCTF